MEFTIARDEARKGIEEGKQRERLNYGKNLQREVDAKNKRQEQCANGAGRGEKMTKEELRMNREMLMEVSKLKKNGDFNNFFQCADKRVTSQE